MSQHLARLLCAASVAPLLAGCSSVQPLGTRGTDHGFGNAMWLIGNRVNGGRTHGEWTGRAKGNLNENRDLPAHHDFRAVLAQALVSSFQLGDSQLAQVPPGVRWDRQLDTLFAKS